MPPVPNCAIKLKVTFCVQGAISPLLANIYLHHVLDEWFEQDVRPRLKGDSTLVRYADDCVLAVSTIEEAQRVLGVLGQRLGRYGLTLHPTKTRLVDFRYRRPGGLCHTASSTEHAGCHD